MRGQLREDHAGPGSPAPVLLTVAEACTALRISRWTLYRLIHTNQLRTVKIGTARRVPAAAIEQFVAGLAPEEMLP
jgi:excisionase family DNA binding protein